VGIEFVENERASAFPRELAPSPQVFAFHQLPGRIARVADEQRAQSASKNLLLQRAGRDFVVVFGVEEDRDGAEGFEKR
jgi:hypothetical protein